MAFSVGASRYVCDWCALLRLWWHLLGGAAFEGVEHWFYNLTADDLLVEQTFA
jgi:hypothetical protein